MVVHLTPLGRSKVNFATGFPPHCIDPTYRSYRLTQFFRSGRKKCDNWSFMTGRMHTHTHTHTHTHIYTTYTHTTHTHTHNIHTHIYTTYTTYTHHTHHTTPHTHTHTHTTTTTTTTSPPPPRPHTHTHTSYTIAITWGALHLVIFLWIEILKCFLELRLNTWDIKPRYLFKLLEL